MSLVVVTCGPASAPIDEVRRITNFSTGEIGTLLAESLAGAGYGVTCCRGRGATFRPPAPPVAGREFVTNSDLLKCLRAIPELPAAVFHAAALCDFEVDLAAGSLGGGRKIDSRASPELQLRLVPAAKILPQLRKLFPAARLVGWKYELDGDRASVLDKARRQIEECRTDACVVNGAAWGRGFGFVTRDGSVQEYASKATLAAGLVNWLGRLLQEPDTPDNLGEMPKPH